MRNLDDLLPWPLTVRGGTDEYVWIAAEPTDHDKEGRPDLVGEHWGIDVSNADERSTEDAAREIVESYCEHLLAEVQRRCGKEQGRP